MLDELKEDTLAKKVGGRFKLSTLIQKRLVQLNRGSPPLVECQGKPSMATVLEEILTDKIYLDATQNVVVAHDNAPGLDRLMDDGPNLD
ncbi:DNA-directed RNA polymerase subunit omega [Planctomicrobium piriforme]|uniref:DNA-directed RNA polymerase subunit omega n=1 Tax=Planctomicrobium piriforme TaxID=1576369 RepID=A0A1I3IFM2_9PLAN|nr:DNA-directed RNA polymerase subunit omega [Planctomicrobium piriforme]SFI46690.1 DNA-directed RNA polymerase subunit omega [Planctomicrobium piriforme]